MDPLDTDSAARLADAAARGRRSVSTIEVGSVVAEGSQRRRAAQMRRRAVEVVVVVVLVVCGIAIPLARLSTPGPSKTTSVRQGPMHLGESVATSIVPLDMAFSSRSRGYALVKVTTGTYVTATTDGGRRWTVASPALASDRLPTTDDVAALGVTAAGVVYVYGSGSGSVIDTNRGRTWVRTRLPGRVEDVTSHGSTLWALVDHAKTSAHRPSPAPAGWLYVSDDGGTRWSRRSTLPGSLGPYLALAHPAALVGYALAPGENNSYAGRYGGLVRTKNGGQSWTVVRQPCDAAAAPRFGDEAEFGAVSANELWMACGDSLPAVGNVTQVARSVDGGRTWTTVAGTEETEVGSFNFPTTGHVPMLTSPATSIFTSHRAWLLLDSPHLLVVSKNQGASWTNGAPKVVEDQRPLLVISVDGAIVVRTRTSLWRLVAGSWACLASARHP